MSNGISVVTCGVGVAGPASGAPARSDSASERVSSSGSRPRLSRSASTHRWYWANAAVRPPRAAAASIRNRWAGSFHGSSSTIRAARVLPWSQRWSRRARARSWDRLSIADVLRLSRRASAQSMNTMASATSMPARKSPV